MCGRYVTPEIADAERNLMVHWLEYQRSFNVAPSQPVPVVRSLSGSRQGSMMRWGLVPWFANGVAPGYSTINASIEKLTDAPCWREPWRRGQRCALVASGFYEWHLLDDGSKRPYYLSCVDQPVFAFAGLWDRSVAADGSETLSCALITMPANALLAQIHNARQRMPAILERRDIDAWLQAEPAQARATLKPYRAEAMRAHPVSSRVNTPKNDDASLLEPLDSTAGTPSQPSPGQASLFA